MTDLAPIIIAITGLLGALGTAGAFVWNKIEGRFKRLETSVAECLERERRSLERRGVQLAVIELLWLELKRVAPQSGVLEQARAMLSDLKLAVLADQVDDKIERKVDR